MHRALVLVVLCSAITLPALSGKKKNAPEPAEPAMAPEAAQAIADYRHNLFESMGKHMRLSSMLVKGKVDAPGDMVLHAQALHSSAASIPNLFPKGTDPGSVQKTDALMSIWEDPEGFKTAVSNYEAATAKLLELAKAGDAEGFKAQFGKVGATCGGCHDSYRKDED